MATPDTDPSRGTPIGAITLNHVIAFVGLLSAMLGVLGIIVGALWGYFTLQRDSSDSKARITALEVSAKESSDRLTKQINDGQDKLAKQIADGEDKTAQQVTALNKGFNERAESLEKYISEVDKTGTQYGRSKIDTRQEDISDLKKRQADTDLVLRELAPKLTAMADHVEQMWGSYMSNMAFVPPTRVDARRVVRDRASN